MWVICLKLSLSSGNIIVNAAGQQQPNHEPWGTFFVDYFCAWAKMTQEPQILTKAHGISSFAEKW
jgi:hypothetical protein